jgi:hypothetical protein
MKLVSKGALLVSVLALGARSVGCGGGTKPGVAGSTTGAGGGAGTDSPCSLYCQHLIAATPASTCVLVDPAGALGACIPRCENALTSLTGPEMVSLEECMACTGETPATYGCVVLCDRADVSSASDKWSTAFGNEPIPSAGLCTNGSNIFAGG